MNSRSYTSTFLFSSTHQQHGLFNTLPRHHANCLHQYSLRKCHHLHHSTKTASLRFHPLNALSSHAKDMPEEGLVPLMDLEELGEKDWSFLGADCIKSKDEHDRKVDQIISAGNVTGSSKILVSMGSEDFVDRMIETSASQFLLVAHESFLSLACIKERHDKVKCWQGGFIDVPRKWAPFHVVFLYYLPSFTYKLEETFKALAGSCAPGGRVVISHLQGRQGLEQERQKYPNHIGSDLPEKPTLEKVASDYSFVMKEYIDDSNFYLAVLELKA